MGPGLKILISGIRGAAARNLRSGLVLVMVLTWPCMALAWSSAAVAQGLFVVSQNNQKVLRYDASTGAFLDTFVSPITQGFQIPGGMALQPSSGVLFVASTATGEIWKYTMATGQVITPRLAGGLFQPGAIAFDATGANLYFADAADGLSTNTDTIKKLVVSSATVSNIATDATANWSGVAVNESYVYASDGYNNNTNVGRIVRFPALGGNGTTIITLPENSLPGGILLRSPTDLLIAEAGLDQVVEYTFNGTSWVFQRTVLQNTAGVDGPCGLALAPDGRLTVSGCFSDNVVAVDLSTLVVSTLVASGAGGLNNAKDVAWSGSTLLVSSLATNSVIYYTNAGVPTGVVARGISIPTDSGMTFAPSGNLVVASAANNDVVEYDGTSGGQVRAFFDACPTSLASPYDVTYGPDGNLYITCTASEGVFRFDATTANPLGFFVSGGSGGLQNPRGLAFGPNGNLFVSSGSTGEILQYNGTTGAFVNVFVDSNGNGGGPLDPYALVFHNGFLYVASFFPSEVKEFNATTGDFVQTFVTSGSGGLSGPKGLDFGPDGNLYVASANDNAVRKYNGANGAFMSVFVSSGSGGLSGPVDLAFKPSAAASNVPTLSDGGAALLFGAILLAGAKRLRGLPRALHSRRRSG